ncbi:MAG: hypothetical protein KF887_13265 [Paracoccaceae bacterium]|nr:MAG: hypothetical protein KF887_13265 [Paracoccaceae bacterium]
MAMIDDLCDQLARDVLAAMDETGDERLHDKISRILIDVSPTTQEIYLKAIRVLLAERRARAFLDQVLSAKREGRAAPSGPRDTGGGH